MAFLSGKFNPWRLAIVVAVVVAIGCWLIYEAGRLGPADEAAVETVVAVHKVFNLLEGLFWTGVGAVLLWRFRRVRNTHLPAIVAGVVFIAFGATDFVEMQTGSWFEPVWLLIWNVACVVSLVACLAWHVALKRRRPPEDRSEGSRPGR